MRIVCVLVASDTNKYAHTIAGCRTQCKQEENRVDTVQQLPTCAAMGTCQFISNQRCDQHISNSTLHAADKSVLFAMEMDKRECSTWCTSCVAALQQLDFLYRRCRNIDIFDVVAVMTKGNFGPDTPAGQLMSERKISFDTMSPQDAVSCARKVYEQWSGMKMWRTCMCVLRIFQTCHPLPVWNWR